MDELRDSFLQLYATMATGNLQQEGWLIFLFGGKYNALQRSENPFQKGGYSVRVLSLYNVIFAERGNCKAVTFGRFHPN